MKKRIYEILEVGRSTDSASRLFDIFIIALIVANAVALTLETVPSLNDKFHNGFLLFEMISVAIFTLEYLARLFTCTENPEYAHPIQGRLQFMLRPLLLIDLAAILPFYLVFMGVDLRSLRIVRLMRIFRIAKLARYNQALKRIGIALKTKTADIMVALFIILILIFISSTLMYFVEHDAQPKLFSSIPATMWWAVATLTTVGYGDVAPVTSLGKLLGSVIAILGIAAFAIPTAILSDAFKELRLNDSKKEQEY